MIEEKKETILVEIYKGEISAIVMSEQKHPFDVIVVDHNTACFRKVPVFFDPDACKTAHTLATLQESDKRDRREVKK